VIPQIDAEIVKPGTHPQDGESKRSADKNSHLWMETNYLGMAHSMANPLTRMRGMTHGLAVGMMLPYVIRFNGPVACEAYMSIASRLFGSDCASDPKEATWQLASDLRKFVLDLRFPDNLKKAGILEEDSEEMAGETLPQATVRSNPREQTLEDMLRIYQWACQGSW